MIYVFRFLFEACWIVCKLIGWQLARDLPNSHSSNKKVVSCSQVFSNNLRKRTRLRCRSPLKSCHGTIEVIEMLLWVSNRLWFCCMVWKRKYFMTQVYYTIWMLEISIVDDVVNVLSDTRVYFQKEEGKNSKISMVAVMKLRHLLENDLIYILLLSFNLNCRTSLNTDCILSELWCIKVYFFQLLVYLVFDYI